MTDMERGQLATTARALYDTGTPVIRIAKLLNIDSNTAMVLTSIHSRNVETSRLPVPHA